ncbi:hypothetical protein L2D08_07640 [Domibacillus sp. PGB-M46]|uniref:hypothetical protein n=1 Tax=Domibacillus sp. PGB-M46 TaxID=2910255 RepID=UPI001F59A452|nr:hypothetical protein [Domibacillus sp. PGB-M46]MCI2254233.1 hypothetical protein [Domibacillus sp. PGB-M46]
MEDKKLIVRLNVDVPMKLKRRIKVYCAREDVDIKEIVILAMESFLDEMEKDLIHSQIRE